MSCGSLGPADEQVKIRGHRIELGEVQAALALGDLTSTPVPLDTRSARRDLAIFLAERPDTWVNWWAPKPLARLHDRFGLEG